VNCNLHRKVFRTSLYQAAIARMPKSVRVKRILRYEDKLHFAFIVETMTQNFYFVASVGENRYEDLWDNSKSGTYQSANESEANCAWVNSVINRTFHRKAW